MVPVMKISSFKQFLLSEGNKLARIVDRQKNQKYIILVSVEKSPSFFYKDGMSNEEKLHIDKQIRPGAP